MKDLVPGLLIVAFGAVSVWMSRRGFAVPARIVVALLAAAASGARAAQLLGAGAAWWRVALFSVISALFALDVVRVVVTMTKLRNNAS